VSWIGGFIVGVLVGVTVILVFAGMLAVLGTEDEAGNDW